MKTLVLAIERAPQFSPNSVEKDRAILMAVVDRLRGKGHEVVVMNETAIPTNVSAAFGDEHAATPLQALPLAIFSMGRLPETLQWLEELSKQSNHNSQLSTLNSQLSPNSQLSTLNSQLRIVNPPEAVALCSHRSRLVERMRQTGTPLPPDWGTHGYWLKRGDACAQQQGDVVFAEDEESCRQLMGRFAERGISEVVVQAHVVGDLVKFYGVLPVSVSAEATEEEWEGERGFFRYYYPTDDGQTKYDDERRNGTAQHYPFSLSHLQVAAERLAVAVGLDVYGGDAIVRTDGTFCIIDFNDWPSFSRCREDAADAIASLL